MTTDPLLLDRDVIRLGGPECRSFLQGLVTANMDRLALGTALYGALLTPQGKIVETFFLTAAPDGDDIWLDVAAGRGAGLLKRLTLYRLRAKVDLADVTEEMAVVADGSTATPGAVASAPDPRHGSLGTRSIVPRDSAPSAADPDTYAQKLIGLGIPEFGIAYGEAEVFPLDVNLDVLGGIDHRKGCFVGQEVASRMFRKGEIRKRTYRVDGAELTPGVKIKAEDTTVATVMVGKGNEALALVRTDRLETAGPDAGVTTEDGREVHLVRPDYLR